MRRNPGLWYALPLIVAMLLFFAAPMVIVVWYSLMPPRSFALTTDIGLQNYRSAFADGYGRPLMWSLLGAALTTLITAVLAWPTAKILHRHTGRWASLVTALIALPIFISESVRLFGLSVFLMPGGGILAGTLNALFDVQIGTILNTRLAALVGMIYIHFPFMLFPLLLGVAMIPADRIEAARDLGASSWAVLREVELPLAAPGLLVGGLLTFVLCLGANAEAAILGGRAVTVITATIEQRFNYAQDWPMGAALTVLVIVVTAALVFPAVRRIDLNRMLRR
ncbi:ABC transporter permease [Pseudotabrizicola algicola]|uniref:ABC transporter permease n=1 Tax=Pseudotabrizicola algicola TaxID=2709381 RepID=A0A6B3RUN1_9RHOB|nr:ABC transporter permease [Pseudotabrizicola algicola]NEX46709.1 ABC transporter permease [Pseudotabrizicola algicola]